MPFSSVMSKFKKGMKDSGSKRIFGKKADNMDEEEKETSKSKTTKKTKGKISTAPSNNFMKQYDKKA